MGFLNDKDPVLMADGVADGVADCALIAVCRDEGVVDVVEICKPPASSRNQNVASEVDVVDSDLIIRWAQFYEQFC
jgi:hypothetical protein